MRILVAGAFLLWAGSAAADTPIHYQIQMTNNFCDPVEIATAERAAVAAISTDDAATAALYDIPLADQGKFIALKNAIHDYAEATKAYRFTLSAVCYDN